MDTALDLQRDLWRKCCSECPTYPTVTLAFLNLSGTKDRVRKPMHLQGVLALPTAQLESRRHSLLRQL
jgi:hypothetical protein